jgi:hypothetical protein
MPQLPEAPRMSLEDFFDYGQEEVIVIPFRDDENRYGSRTIIAQPIPIGTITELPELDLADDAVVIDPADHLVCTGFRLDHGVVLFEAEPNKKLLERADFQRSVAGREIAFRMLFREKVTPPYRATRHFPGAFMARFEKIERQRRIAWESHPENSPTSVTRSTDFEGLESVITVDPDGKSAFVVTLSLEQWNTKRSRWDRSKEDVVYSSWFARDDPDLTLNVLAPEPRPVPRYQDNPADPQATTLWRSKTPLPSESHKTLVPPFETKLNVKAWRRVDVIGRIEGDIEHVPGAQPLVEDWITLRFMRRLELAAQLAKRAGTQYGGYTFASDNQFITDGIDMVRFDACARRVGSEPEEVDTDADIEVELQPDDGIYQLATSKGADGRVHVQVRSTEKWVTTPQQPSPPPVSVLVKGGPFSPGLEPITIELQPVAEPHLTLDLRLGPPALARGATTTTPHAESILLGDGADLVFAYCELAVEPSDWEVDGDPTFTFKLTGADAKAWMADRFFSEHPDLAQAFFRDNPHLTPDDGQVKRMVVVRAGWLESGRAPLTLQVDVEARVRHKRGGTAGPLPASAEKTIEVVGATPSLALAPSSDAYADGAYVVTIEPNLTLFGELYPAGLKPAAALSARTADGNNLVIDDFFELLPHERSQQKLRCKFHLEGDSGMRLIGDQPMEISFGVELTNDTALAAFTLHDHLWREHVRSCTETYKTGIPAPASEDAAHLIVWPCKISLTTDAAALPKAPGAAEPFTARISAIVHSPAPGAKYDAKAALDKDKPFGFPNEWKLDFDYDPSGLLPKFSVPVKDAQPSGQLLFEQAGANVSGYCYELISQCLEPPLLLAPTPGVPHTPAPRRLFDANSSSVIKSLAGRLATLRVALEVMDRAAPLEVNRQDVAISLPSCTLVATPNTVAATSRDDDTILVTPVLQAGGNEYRNQLKLTLPVPYDDELFAEVPDPTAQAAGQIKLRCKFHLAAEKAIESLQHGLAQLSLTSDFVEATLAKLAPDGLMPNEPASVWVKGCTFKMAWDPEEIPRLNRTAAGGPGRGQPDNPKPLFKANLHVTLHDSKDRGITSDNIKRDRAKIIAAHKSFEAYLADWLSVEFKHDPTNTAPVPQARVGGVNAQGRLLFHVAYDGVFPLDTLDHVSYDHLPAVSASQDQSLRMRAVNWDHSKYELKFPLPGTTCALNAIMQMKSRVLAQGRLTIGEQVYSIKKSWDFSPFVLRDGLVAAGDRPSDPGFYGWNVLKLLHQLGYELGPRVNGQPAISMRQWDDIIIGHDVAKAKDAYAKLLLAHGYPRKQLWEAVTTGKMQFKAFTVIYASFNLDGVGHHGIVLPVSDYSKRLLIGHFQMGAYRIEKWFNRDQIWRKGEEGSVRSTAENNAVRGTEACVMFDRYEEFSVTGKRILTDADPIFVFEPPAKLPDLPNLRRKWHFE